MKQQKIAVIGAMEQEIECLKNALEDMKPICFGKFKAYEGILSGKRVVVVLSGIGKVNAAAATAWVASVFRPDGIINTGSAGGLGSGLKVGDVVIGTQTAHHDVDVTAFGYEWGQVPQLPRYFDSHQTLITLAETAAKAFEGAAVYRGLIVSGDRFVSSSAGVEEIRSRFANVQAVEMEAAAIAQTCYQFEIPFVVIRAISDSADEKADISFEAFLETAALSSAKMVMQMIAEWQMP